MKLIELVNARYAIQKLVAQDLPIRTAYQLMKFTDACNFHLNFYGQEREKLGAEPDAEKLAELDGMEIDDVDLTVIRIPVTDDLRLSASDIKALEPFIEFIFPS